jgi:hypothetical protein
MTSRRPTDELQGDTRRWNIVRRLAACLAVLVLFGIVAPVTASTTDSQEHRIVDQINA